tara:strand:- start:1667 stop:2053 length:387 start_codon:yes stop_codon:yes gene_type:complete
MNINDIRESLQAINDLRGTLEAYESENRRVVDLITPQEVTERLEHQATRHEQKTASAREALANLEAHVKAGVLTLGSSIRHDDLQAVYSRGRVKWDTAKLDGLMLAIPNIRECRNVGRPYVSIREAAK